MSLQASLAQLYNNYYFREGLGPDPYERTEPWLSFFAAVADRISLDIGPESALDVGCATGMLVEALRAHEIDARGFDLSVYALSQMPVEVAKHCWPGEAQDPMSYADRQYDLITCVEVVEHLPEAAAQYAIGLMCQHTRTILFSSSPTDFTEPTHINVHGPEYWAEQFARFSFLRDLDFDVAFLSPWAALYRLTDMPLHRVVFKYERELWERLQQNHTQRAQILTMQKELGNAG